jgi:hypothetical protein
MSRLIAAIPATLSTIQTIQDTYGKECVVKNPKNQIVPHTIKYQSEPFETSFELPSKIHNIKENKLRS